MYKIKILENDNLENDIFEYLMTNSKELTRDVSINSILEENYSIEDKNFLICNTQFSTHIYGTTFQGHGTRQLNLSYASHIVKQFIKEEGQLYGMVEFLDTAIGRGLKFASDLEYTLVPMYTVDKKLNGFDIDTNIKFTYLIPILARGSS
jgi:hypothetical protein